MVANCDSAQPLQKRGTVMRALIPGIAAAALAGCITLHDLDKQVPVYSGEAKGMYLALAECVQAREVSAGNSQLTLAKDREAREAKLVVNSDVGPITAYVFREAGPSQTSLRIYSIAQVRDATLSRVKSCEQA